MVIWKCQRKHPCWFSCPDPMIGCPKFPIVVAQLTKTVKKKKREEKKHIVSSIMNQCCDGDISRNMDEKREPKRVAGPVIERLVLLLAMTKVEETTWEGGGKVIEGGWRVGGKRAIGAGTVDRSQLRAFLNGAGLDLGLVFPGAGIRARFSGRQDEELVARVVGARHSGRENQETVGGGVSVHCEKTFEGFVWRRSSSVKDGIFGLLERKL